MEVVKAISSWLRDLHAFQARPEWYRDKAGLLPLMQRKAELFAQMAEVQPNDPQYVDVAAKARAQVTELLAELDVARRLAALEATS